MLHNLTQKFPSLEFVKLNSLSQNIVSLPKKYPKLVTLDAIQQTFFHKIALQGRVWLPTFRVDPISKKWINHFFSIYVLFFDDALLWDHPKSTGYLRKWISSIFALVIIFLEANNVIILRSFPNEIWPSNLMTLTLWYAPQFRYLLNTDTI